jgi:DNA-binding NarL/FixJ family response regulator
VKRIVIVADCALVAHRIREALRQAAGFDVVGYADGREAVRGVLERHQPALVIVEEMGDRSAVLARLSEVSACVPSAMAILLSGSMDPAWLHEAFAAGADSVISKSVQPVAFATLLRETAAGTVLHPVPAAPSLPPTHASLTLREQEILGYVSMGQTNIAIARALWVTEQTVKFHLSNIYRKLGVANRTEASRYAHVHHLLPEETRQAS